MLQDIKLMFLKTSSNFLKAKILKLANEINLENPQTTWYQYIGRNKQNATGTYMSRAESILSVVNNDYNSSQYNLWHIYLMVLG